MICFTELIDTRHERDELKETVARLQKQIDDYRTKMTRVRKIEAMLKDVQEELAKVYEENERLKRLLDSSGSMRDQAKQLEVPLLLPQSLSSQSDRATCSPTGGA